MNVEKLEKDGKVAVLISPDFGAGWSTWADDEHKLFMLFDSNLVNLVLDKKYDEAVKLVKERNKNIYTGGIREIEVVWVDKGTQFRVTEYDGYESIEYSHDSYWVQA